MPTGKINGKEIIFFPTKYGLTRNVTKGEVVGWHISVPRHIAELLPPDIKFRCALTEEGILFAPVTEAARTQAAIPSWVKPEQDQKQ